MRALSADPNGCEIFRFDSSLRSAAAGWLSSHSSSKLRLGRAATMEKRPEDYLRLSDAYSRLADGMWGGLPRAEAERAIRRRLKIEPAYGEIYFGYGPWRERAADCLTRAALVGKLTVHVVKDRTFDLNSSSLGNAAVTHHIDAMVVPVKIL